MLLPSGAKYSASVPLKLQKATGGSGGYGVSFLQIRFLLKFK